MFTTAVDTQRDESTEDAAEAGSFFPSVLHPEEGIDCDMPLHLVPPLSPGFGAPREERGPRRSNVIRRCEEQTSEAKNRQCRHMCITVHEQN